MSKVRSDIARQRDIDESRSSPQASLAARMKAVVVAQRRLCLREPDAGYELRQALVDLAAVAEIIADELPAPNKKNACPAVKGGPGRPRPARYTRKARTCAEFAAKRLQR